MEQIPLIRRLAYEALASEVSVDDVTSRFLTPASRSVAEALTQRLRASRAATCCDTGDEHCESCKARAASELRKAVG